MSKITETRSETVNRIDMNTLTVAREWIITGDFSLARAEQALRRITSNYAYSNRYSQSLGFGAEPHTLVWGSTIRTVRADIARPLMGLARNL